jgi:hypothetical protein
MFQQVADIPLCTQIGRNLHTNARSWGKRQSALLYLYLCCNLQDRELKKKYVAWASTECILFSKRGFNSNWHLLIVKKAVAVYKQRIVTGGTGLIWRASISDHFQTHPIIPCGLVIWNKLYQKKNNISTCILYMIYFKPVWTPPCSDYFMFNSNLITPNSFRIYWLKSHCWSHVTRYTSIYVIRNIKDFIQTDVVSYRKS